MPVRARAALQRIVKGAAVAADHLRPPPSGIVVLIYHRVGGGSGLEVDLPTSAFEAQISGLAASGRVLSLDDAVARLAGPPIAGPSPVVITFDDGTADFADVAVPILARHQVPATLYAATGFIDEGRAFPHDGTPVSWAGLADACASGVVTVGSHTHNHRLLDRLPPEQVAEELDRSIALIGEHLGTPALHFAYPKALLGSPAAQAAVAERFVSAAVAGTRPNAVGRTDVHRLARSPIQVADGMASFRRKADGGMGLEDQLRRVINRARYVSATT